MSLPPRFVPPTLLADLRTLLARYSEEDTTFREALDRLLDRLQRLALPELGQRLAGNATPIGLRRCLLQACGERPWPEWTPALVAMLEHEEDPDLFKEGCGALVGLGTRGAMQGLLGLKRLRKDPGRQELLDQAFSHFQPDASFEACLGQTLEGLAEPERARQGGRWLAALARPEHLDALLDAFHRGDALSRHLLLDTLAQLEGPEAGQALLELLAELEADFLECTLLGEFLAGVNGFPPITQREKVFELAGTRFPACGPGLILALRENLIDAERFPFPDLEPLQAEAKGPLRTFLMQALRFPVRDRVRGFSALLLAAHAGLPARRAELAARVDDLASLLVAKALAGEVPAEPLLPVLEEVFLAGAGGEALTLAYLRLIPGGDLERLGRLLAEPEPGRRKAFLELLGAREDDQLAPFFLKAMNDPVKEVGQVAIHQLGRLDSGLPGMLDLFRSTQVERVREAVRFFSENQTRAAVKPLVAFLANENPDDLMVDAVEALGHIGDPAALNPLLRLLHSGKPLALQMAIVEALTRLRSPLASLGLLKKAEDLTLPPVLLAALQGALAAFPDFEHPLPPTQAPAVEHLVERCCDPREGAGHWLEAALTMQDLYVFDGHLYDHLVARFTQALVEMRQKPGWEHRSHEQVVEVIKKLNRRAQSLTTLEEREKALETAMKTSPAAGPRRMQALFQLREALAEPEHIMRPTFARTLVAFLEQELGREDLEFEAFSSLCAIAGQSRQAALVETLEDLYAHAGNPGLKAPVRQALLALGLSEREILGRKPIRSILLFEPNAFFRNRLAPVLGGLGRTLDVAATRQEAHAVLAAKRVDLLISESHDAMGDLWLWLTAKWEHRRCRYLLLSTSSHDAGPLAGKPWVLGRLYKPYAPEDLVRIIEG